MKSEAPLNIASRLCRTIQLPVLAICAVSWPVVASAQGDADADLAKKLANPIASLTSVPFQLNVDGRIGPDREGERATLNIQPVVPFKLDGEMTLVSRTILPVISQTDVAGPSGHQFGLGDTVQSFFLVPASDSGLTWGAGPVFLLPTGSDRLLSSGKWGAGPTFVVLNQKNGWTVGVLANHVWSLAGDDDRAGISNTLLNPFINRTSKTALTVSLAADATYDWKNERWTMPVTLSASQLVRLGKQRASVGAAARYYVEATDGSPHGLAGRLFVTLLFPKH